jgi:hypothetical protein
VKAAEAVALSRFARRLSHSAMVSASLIGQGAGRAHDRGAQVGHAHAAVLLAEEAPRVAEGPLARCFGRKARELATREGHERGELGHEGLGGPEA